MHFLGKQEGAAFFFFFCFEYISFPLRNFLLCVNISLPDQNSPEGSFMRICCAVSGLMMECEKKIFDLMDAKTPMSKYWMPLVWATNIINRARKEALIQSDHVVQTMLVELSDIRRRLGSLIGYDTVCVPLVYTQVISLFATCSIRGLHVDTLFEYE